MWEESIFIEPPNWAKSGSHLEELQELRRLGSPKQIREYFSQQSAHGTILRQATSQQLAKAETAVRCRKIKGIYKDKMRRGWAADRNNRRRGLELEMKRSEQTASSDEEEREVEQYLNFEIQ